MDAALFHFLCPLAALVGDLAVQILCFRLIPKISMLRSLFLGFGVGLAIVVAGESAITLHFPSPPSSRLGMLLANLLIFTALGYGYFHFINLGETARRVRILREIYEAQGGLTIAEIFQRYNPQVIFQYRLNRLLRNSQIVLEEDRYRIAKPAMLWICNIIIFLKILLLGKRSEFD